MSKEYAELIERSEELEKQKEKVKAADIETARKMIAGGQAILAYYCEPYEPKKSKSGRPKGSKNKPKSDEIAEESSTSA